MNITKITWILRWQKEKHTTVNKVIFAALFGNESFEYVPNVLWLCIIIHKRTKRNISQRQLLIFSSFVSLKSTLNRKYYYKAIFIHSIKMLVVVCDVAFSMLIPWHRLITTITVSCVLHGNLFYALTRKFNIIYLTYCWIEKINLSKHFSPAFFDKLTFLQDLFGSLIFEQTAKLCKFTFDITMEVNIRSSSGFERNPTPGKLSMWSKCLLCFST